MTKFVAAVAVVLAAAAVSVGVASGSGGPTVVASGFPCAILDGNGDTFITTNSVLTLYSSGKVVLQCEGDGAPAPSLTYFNFGNTGLTCGMLQFGSTTDWFDKVGRNGNSQLRCTTFVDDAAAASASAGGAGIG